MQPLSGLFETVHRDQSQELRNHERGKENGFVAKKQRICLAQECCKRELQLELERETGRGIKWC